MNVFLIATISLDGKIAKSEAHNSFSWTSQEDKNFFKEKTKEAGVVIIGRKTWETIGKPLEGRLTVVMTRDPNRFYDNFVTSSGDTATGSPTARNIVSTDGVVAVTGPDAGEVEFTNKLPVEILKDLESRGYKGAAVAGGAEIYSLFLQDNLIDELYLTIHPVIFGEGIEFIDRCKENNFKLLGMQKFSDDVILVRYKFIS